MSNFESFWGCPWRLPIKVRVMARKGKKQPPRDGMFYLEDADFHMIALFSWHDREGFETARHKALWLAQMINSSNP